MNDAPVVLGINRNQDASICLMHGSQLVWAIQKERLTRQKHHRGKQAVASFRRMPLHAPAMPPYERVKKSSMAALRRLAVLAYCLRRRALPWSFFHTLYPARKRAQLELPELPE